MPTDDSESDKTEKGQYELMEGAARAAKLARRLISAERIGFVDGLLGELRELAHEHVARVQELAELEARIEIGERNLIATRDYINSVLSSSDEALPEGWLELIRSLEFLGMRLGDAAVEVLRRNSDAMSAGEIEAALNNGQFRFRTGSPRREIHAALLRQPKVDRVGDKWLYVSDEEKEERSIA